MGLKIGILTLPIAENYGGILQAVALYRFLYHQGHDVILIYKKNIEIKQFSWRIFIRELLLKIPFYDFRGYKHLKNESKKRRDIHRSFIENEIYKISKILHSKQELEEFANNENFDAVIVGSDQVWRKEYINDRYYKSYFLDFVDDKKTKKIAYAASFGKDHWEGLDDITDISKLMKEFNGISTRESSGIDICKNSFDYNNAQLVLDPTLLMNKTFYIEELISKYDTMNINKGGLVTYFLDNTDQKNELVHLVQNSLGIDQVFHLKGFNELKITYTVPQWLASIAYADFVITDSFHGMLFSIIFEKNFLVIGNRNRGIDRFISLLSLLNLQDKLIYNKNDFMMLDIKQNIDWITVNQQIKNYKDKSIMFLESNLDGK